jgi:hypothetical protein
MGRRQGTGIATEKFENATWGVEKFNRDHLLTFHNVKEGWKQRLCFLGDPHWDNPHCDRLLLRKKLDEAKESDSPVMSVGDLFCAMQGKYDPRRNPKDVRPEHMVEDYLDALTYTAAEWWRPWARQIALLGKGNHEQSILRHNQVDLTRNFAYRLRNETANMENRAFTGYYGGRLFLDFRKPDGKLVQREQVRYFHGSGGGGPVTKGTIQPLRRAAKWPDADYVVVGHIHEAWAFPIKRERIYRGKVHLPIQWHLQTPTFKEEYGMGQDGFHIERDRPPKPVGCVWLNFYYYRGAVRAKVELDII